MDAVTNPLQMKEMNTRMIKMILKQEKQATKQRLAEISGLSTVTIGNILNQLVQDQEVYEMELLPSSGGRPAHQFCFNKDYSHALIAYMWIKEGKEIIKLQVINLFNEIVEETTTSYCSVEVSDIDDLFDPYIERYEHIRLIGLGLPGVEDQGIITHNDSKKLIGVDFPQHINERYGLSCVIGNDVNLAVLGYLHNHESNDELTVYIYFPKVACPGAGISWRNEIHVGRNKEAGELAHLPIQVDWLTLDYQNVNAVSDALTKLLIVYQTIIDPHKIVLAGDFLEDAHLEMISKLWKNEYAQKIHEPKVEISNHFLLDYEMGTRIHTLLNLDPMIQR